MFKEKSLAKAGVAAVQNIKERDFWLDKLSAPPPKTGFPYDFKAGIEGSDLGPHRRVETVKFSLPDESYSPLMRMTAGDNYALQIILTAGAVLLLARYRDKKDIIVGTAIYKQDSNIDFINTVLALRNRLHPGMTFKELLMQERETVIEAVKHQNYPVEILLEQLDLAAPAHDFPLFDIAILLNNIHDEAYIRHINPNMVFCFLRTDTGIRGELRYNPLRYKRITGERIAGHYTVLMGAALTDVEQEIFDIDMLTPEEKQQLLIDFNDTETEYPRAAAIHTLFARQAARTPDHIAAADVDPERHLGYGELNRSARQLAGRLRERGIGPGSVVGIMVPRSLEMIAALLGISKAGAAYLPIDTAMPTHRVLYMLEDAGAKLLITDSRDDAPIPFTSLQALDAARRTGIIVTAPRSHIRDFNSLPMPDRSLLNLKNYKNRIGMASTTNCISIQAARGCPYQCLFCHKVWSKHHVFREAENIYNEIDYYYKKGVTNFAFIDDCFNLDRHNSSRFFQLVIKNKLNVRLFFPNGLRGDIMRPEDVDLMVEAGTRGINLSLETASPRLQQLIKKHLDIDKFKHIVDYIAGRHPGVILEIAAMHGFPTETPEEAMMTLDFIKEVKWLHFPYIHILKIYPNTGMEALALEQGISKKDIIASKDLAYHQLPETLPFPKGFTRRYQAEFMNGYFLLKERLKQVLPIQLEILGSRALVEKYDAYLPVSIKSIEDIVTFAHIDDIELERQCPPEKEHSPAFFAEEAAEPGAQITGKKILLLDLSRHFSSHDRGMLYNVSEQPLGLISLLTYLQQKFGTRIHGRIYKSGNDFDSYDRLKALVDEYRPDLVGIRTLTFYKEFFHETVSLLKQWCGDAAIIAGGPYATSDYDTMLQDDNVDLAVLGEGEYTTAELIQHMLENDFNIPPLDILKEIAGIAFVEKRAGGGASRRVMALDRMEGCGDGEEDLPEPAVPGTSPAYVMYTSGSTGQPKGVMVEHRQVNNCICWMQDKFNLSRGDVIVQRTNLTFDPSVWEIFWPLQVGGRIKVLNNYQSQDAEFLIELMSEEADTGLTMMYCPATLVRAMTGLLEANVGKPRLKLPWLIIGAEPISMEVVKTFYRYYEGKIVNTYGPTECTINNTYYDLEAGDPRSIVPIGKPVANNKIYILSDRLQLMPLNTAGQICIAGDSTARGYINNPERTAGSFINNPFAAGKLYKTGDMGRWLEDGTIEVLGRMDHQVKIRGYRIEPGEIESVLCSHASVKQALVMVRDNRSRQDKIAACKTCGITSAYPGVKIDNQGFCNICESFSQIKKYIDAYFKSPDELAELIREENKQRQGKYDCLLLYAGGRGSAYALYRLVEMGFNVLTVTYDNGYFGKAHLANIKKITAGLGVDHVVLRHNHTDDILRESMKAAYTVCRGCFHTSSALAGQYAYKNNIPVVVGATLSRGQIIENKLYMFLQQGITGVEELENEILKLHKITRTVDKSIFAYIDIDLSTEVSSLLYDKVRFIDFYSCCDISNEEMIAYLDNKSPYWKTRKTYAVYSSNCPIKQVGDYCHLQGRNYHYYGSAASWEKRMGHLGLEDIKEDLRCRITRKGYENFLGRIGHVEEPMVEADDRQLCAYIVSEEAVPVSQWRERLSGKLPGYMIPSYFVIVDKLPLTPDGKVDRAGLPPPRLESGESYEAPRNSREKKLAEIWSEVLDIEDDVIGIDSNFFELGGHSLKATVLASRIHREFNVKIPLAELFQLLDIRSLAEYIKKAAADEYTFINPVEQRSYYPVSSVQKRLYFLQQLDPGNISYNLPEAAVLEGIIHTGGLERTFRELISRHDSLRTSFQLIAGEPVQRIHDHAAFEIEYYDSNRSPEETVHDFIRPFDLSVAPLMRVGLIKSGQEKSILMVDMHHIISDGSSHAILVKEFMALYAGEPLPGLRLQYWDYSEWQNGKEQKEAVMKQEAFWLEQFRGEIPVLKLPGDYARPRAKSFEGGTFTFELSMKETQELKTRVLEAEVTLFIMLLAIFNVFLAKMSGQEDIIVGTSAAGRGHADLERIIGMFVNALALRNFPRPARTFSDFLKEVKERTISAFENQDYQFENLVEKMNVKVSRDTGRNPVFDVMFVLNNEGRPHLEIQGLKLKPCPFEIKAAQLDLKLRAVEGKEDIFFSLEYSTKLFTRKTMEMYAGNFKEVLFSVIRNINIKLEDIRVSHDLGSAETNMPETGFDF